MRKKFLDYSINSIKKRFPEYDQDKIDAISYGLEGLYITFTKTIVIFCIAFMLGIAKGVLCILLSYNVIRTTAFGLHAKSSFQCYIISGFLFIGTAFICKYVDINIYIKYLISIVAFITLAIYAPADTYKRPLINKYKRKKYKIITIILCLVYLILIIIFKSSIVSSYLSFGLLDASLMVHPLMYRVFQLPYNNYKDYDVVYS